MITNKICENCKSWDVCNLADILYKFHEDAKKDLGVDITIDACKNHLPLDEEDNDIIDAEFTEASDDE